LQHARLTGADLRGANLTQVDLRGLDLKGVRLNVEHAVLLAQCYGARVE
jgi:fluoroquinolone resistance protein